MLDRASTFADPKIVDMLKTRFVPVAIDQACQRRQQDTEGDFYRAIAGQGPRNDFENTTQGFYIASASGDLLLYNNNRDPAKLRGLMQEKLKEFQQRGAASDVDRIQAKKKDPRFHVRPPEGGIIVRVHARVLEGYEPTTDRWRQIFQNALSRDNLWISADEHKSIVRGILPVDLQRRIARFHLVDNTRGEPPMWKPEEIRGLQMNVRDGRLSGKVQLKSRRGDRSYDADLKGIIEVRNGAVVRFDMVALGEFEGEGSYTQHAPKGKFPLAISFTLADGTDIADGVPPQGSRGWLEGYMR